MKRIKKFGILETAKVAAVLCFILSLIFILPFSIFFPSHVFPQKILIIILPFLYSFVGFILTAISCFIYNNIVKMTGGIGVYFETEE